MKSDLGSRYSIQKQLGKKPGRYTYLALDEETQNLVVVKLLKLDRDFEWDSLKLFEREAQILKNLSHPAIPEYLDYFDVDSPDTKGFALVQSYIDATSLEEQVSNGRTFDEAQLKEIAENILNILIHLHQRKPSIIHRDIKPSNIMIVQDRTLGELAKILDFGVAKLIQAGNDQTHCFMGTLAYASPEQMEGRDLDNRSDIYSFGVMMFQMLTGHLPLRASSHTFGGWYKVHLNQEPKKIRDVARDLSVPKLLEDVVMQCLAKHPEERPQKVRDILQALEPLESRFVPGFQISQRIGTTLTRLPVTRQPDPSTAVKEDQVCKLTVWPKNKPVAEIVFPHPLPTSQGPIVTLWAMMPQEEINRRLVSTRYNTFICTMSPHPMMLWLTVLYSSTYGARWLPCYVDLKSSMGQQIAGLLKDTGTYKLLFFALESPGGCAHVLTCSIAGPQRGMLQEWALTAQSRPSVGAASTSRDILRNEFKTKLKQKVLQKLESIYVDTGSNLAE